VIAKSQRKSLKNLLLLAPTRLWLKAPSVHVEALLEISSSVSARDCNQAVHALPSDMTLACFTTPALCRQVCSSRTGSGINSKPRANIGRRHEVRRRGRGHSTVMRVVRFRPCIDLHAGRVKQIVGGTLADGDGASAPETNFETDMAPSYFASLYARDELPGGHVIMLGPGNESAAEDALAVFPGGMHVGGGVNPSNSARYLDAGASHVIVTSYVFRDGEVDWDRVDEMTRAVGRSHLVLDVSCRRRPRGSDDAKDARNRGGADDWIVCTDRWQKWTNMVLGPETIGRLGDCCDELLVHAVDVEGKRGGMDEELVARLADWTQVPVTYAGGVRTLEDLDRAKELGRGLVDVTIGSALDIFGGDLAYEDAVRWQRAQEAAAAAAGGGPVRSRAPA
jgi:phosphoribosylformimino-5-aminoimidazole carboxamide ribotide isomerase